MENKEKGIVEADGMFFGLRLSTIFQTLLISGMIGLYTKFDRVVTQNVVQEEKIRIISRDLDQIQLDLKEVKMDVSKIARTQESIKAKISP